jgi:hypothetical protein
MIAPPHPHRLLQFKSFSTKSDSMGHVIDIFSEEPEPDAAAMERARSAGEARLAAMLSGETETRTSLVGGAKPPRYTVLDINKTAEEQYDLKCRVLERMLQGDGGCAVISAAKAAALLHIPVTWVRVWLKSDVQWALAVKEAEETLSHLLAEDLLTIHDTVRDPKAAKIASDNIKWYIGKKSEDFADRKADTRDNAALVDLLREAIDRIPRPAAAPSQVVDID